MVVITFVQEPTIHYTIDVEKVYFLMILHYNVWLINFFLLVNMQLLQYQRCGRNGKQNKYYM